LFEELYCGSLQIGRQIQCVEKCYLAGIIRIRVEIEPDKKDWFSTSTRLVYRLCCSKCQV
jgi:hypothetical protein